MRHLSHIGEWYCSAAADTSRLIAFVYIHFLLIPLLYMPAHLINSIFFLKYVVIQKIALTSPLLYNQLTKSTPLPGDYKFTVTAAEAGTDLSCAEAAQAAYDYGHSGNPISDLMCYFKCITGSVTQGDIMKAANADGVRKAVDKALADYNERMGKNKEQSESGCAKNGKRAYKIIYDKG